MKNPKWQCAYPNSNRIVFGGKFLTQWKGYKLTLQQSTGGTISANREYGYQGDQATLSNSPNNDYGFVGYSITGATLTGNKFKFQENDVTAKAIFSANYYPSSARVQIGNQIWSKYDLRYLPSGFSRYKIDGDTYYYSGYYDQSTPSTSGVVTINTARNYDGFKYTYWAALEAGRQVVGWNLPTSGQWNTLRNNADTQAGTANNAGKNLKYSADRGSDIFGFSISGTGNGSTPYWTSTRYLQDDGMVFYVNYNYDWLQNSWYYGNALCRVRLIME